MTHFDSLALFDGYLDARLFAEASSASLVVGRLLFGLLVDDRLAQLDVERLVLLVVLVVHNVHIDVLPAFANDIEY